MNGFLDLKASKLFKQFIVFSENILSHHGYNFIKLPIFDTFQNQIKTTNDYNELISIRSSKEVFVLRKDMTHQLAGYIASLKERHLPMKIYYEGEVFSWKNEIQINYQLGIEYIGYKEQEGIIDSIKLLKELLGFFDKNTKIYLNNTTIINSIISTYEDEHKNIISKALMQKNIISLKYYNLEWLLSEDLDILLKNLQSLNIQTNKLIDLMKALRNENIEIKLDLLELKDLPYYDGIVFAFYSHHLPFAIASGGEYNILNSIYNLDIRACGGAIYLSEILERY